MRYAAIWLILLCGLTDICAGTSRAMGTGGAAECRAAIGNVEAARHIPDAFLAAIARVESGRADPATGALAPWPWTINAEGVGSYFDTKAEAIAAIHALQARGVRSIDVGCLQVNLLQHPDAFASLDEALDPAANATAAGALLLSLFDHFHSWPLAAAAYHSQTPTIGAAYQRRVLAEWAVPDANAQPSRPESRRADAGEGMALLGASHPAAARAVAVPASRDVGQQTSAAVPGGGQGGAIGHVAAFASRATPGAAGIATTGRSLAAYRLMPTALALRQTWKPG